MTHQKKLNEMVANSFNAARCQFKHLRARAGRAHSWKTASVPACLVDNPYWKGSQLEDGLYPCW